VKHTRLAMGVGVRINLEQRTLTAGSFVTFMAHAPGRLRVTPIGRQSV